MKQDLDRLMEERGLDAAVVSGKVQGNPNLAYMLNGAEVSFGIVVKLRGGKTFFIHSPLEREEAAASGLELVNMNNYDIRSIMRQTESRLEADIELYRRILADLGVSGEVGFYGAADRGASYVFLQALDRAMPDVTVRGEYERNIFATARATKDAAEVEFIRQAGVDTAEVVLETIEFMRRHRVVDETLLQKDGSPLTIGVVKQHILRLLAERRLEDPEGVIFAIGRDGGVPHNKGNPNDPIRLGQTIVYDIYPRRPGGYFFDCTRTFCLGYAPPEVEKVYRDVVECTDTVIAAVQVGIEARYLQQLTCSFFEERGYETSAGNPRLEEGYIHSVSHGLGLDVHEEPRFSDVPSNTATLQPGHVFTVEPGLYYPSRGFGIRIEDVVWIDEQGQVHNLTNLERNLVVEMAG